ncbi:MAG: hypothetical protein ACTH6S_12965 [Mesonia sp.]|uniref:hypothetical protein n=1 Tax=Mesonia sp. TaxID=1960830 RepID=UPI003F99144A
MNIRQLTLLSILLLTFTLSSCDNEPLEGEFSSVTQNPTEDENPNNQDGDNDGDDDNNDDGDNQDDNGNNDGDDNDGNDDGNDENTSNFTIESTEYPTPNGYIISDFDGTNNSVHAIYLINGTLINNEFYGQGCDFSNDLTQGAIFNIRSTSISNLEAGTYEYELSTFESSLNETNISTNIIVSDNCVTGSDSISENQITSGSITIQMTNGVYTLNYTFETNDFGTIIGTYVGELQVAEDLS